MSLMIKNPFANAGDIRDAYMIPGWGRYPDEEMATHSSTLARIIPRKKDPGEL